MDLVNHLPDRLLFAVPKTGRLHDAAIKLLAGSDVQFHRQSRLDIALVKNLPICLVFLRAADIPTFVGTGKVDLGITGQDQVREYEAAIPSESTQGVQEVLDLEFGGCKLQVQVPEKGDITRPEQLIGKNVVTSFTEVSRKYFAELEQKENAAAVSNGDKPAQRSTKTNLIHLGGSVEAAVALGVGDGIVDLVESGETMKAAGLKAISTVLESTAVMIRSKHSSQPDLIKLITSRIQGVINAQKYVLCTYNVHRDQLDRACKITPGKRSPTVNHTEEDGWVAVSAMVERAKVATTMDDLVAIGACDIMITKLENTR